MTIVRSSDVQLGLQEKEIRTGTKILPPPVPDAAAKAEDKGQAKLRGAEKITEIAGLPSCT